MELIFPVFALGLMVTLVIAKGMMQASDYTKQELQKMKGNLTEQHKNVEE